MRLFAYLLQAHEFLAAERISEALELESQKTHREALAYKVHVQVAEPRQSGCKPVHGQYGVLAEATAKISHGHSPQECDLEGVGVVGCGGVTCVRRDTVREEPRVALVNVEGVDMLHVWRR